MFEAILQTKNCCFPLRGGGKFGIRGEELWCIEHDSKSLLEELMTARTTNANFANQRSCYIKIIALVTEPKICVTSVKCLLYLSPKYPTSNFFALKRPERMIKLHSFDGKIKRFSGPESNP